MELVHPHGHYWSEQDLFGTGASRWGKVDRRPCLDANAQSHHIFTYVGLRLIALSRLTFLGNFTLDIALELI